MTPEERAKRIRLLVLDVDGVLTDGGLYYDPLGEVSKRFHVQDGLGIKLAQAGGNEVAAITGLESEAVRARLEQLGIKRRQMGHAKKLPFLQEMANELGFDITETAFMGDDWVDAAVMRRVGLALAVANAQPEILSLAHWVSTREGGRGAVREAIAFILTAQGKYASLWRKWCD